MNSSAFNYNSNNTYSSLAKYGTSRCCSGGIIAPYFATARLLNSSKGGNSGVIAYIPLDRNCDKPQKYSNASLCANGTTTDCITAYPDFCVSKQAQK